MKTKLLIFSVFSCLAVSSCSYTSGFLERRPIFDDVKFVSLNNELHPGVSIGHVKSEACNKAIFGFSIGDNASYQNALNNISAETGARYIKNVKSNWYAEEIFFYKKACFEVEGDGFK